MKLLKILQIALFLCLNVSLASAQISKNPGDFDKIKVFDKIALELIPSDVARVELSGPGSEEVELINRNGELRIRMKRTKFLAGESVEARVHYVSLRSIEAAEGSVVNSGSKIDTPHLELSAVESAEIKLSVDVENLVTKANRGGKIELLGNAESHRITLGTGGELRAGKLETSTTKVSINAGGTAQVRASETVEARVNAGGSVEIFGKPKVIDEKIVLGGSVRKME